MTSSPPLLRRLLLGTALACVVVGMLVIIGLRIVTPIVQTAALEHQLSGIDHDACTAAPESWGWKSGDMSFFAYDRAGRSRNPNAPPIEPTLLQKVVAQQGVAVEMSPNRILSVALHAPDGPCAILRLTSKNLNAPISLHIRGVLASAIIVGMILTVLGTFLLVVRPLQKRIEEVADAAKDVGSDAFTPQQLQNTDALAHIAQMLTQSHHRLQEAHQALEARNKALEHHLAGVAHDLRTPLASMHLALEALATQSQGSMREEAQRALADVVFLSSMVENLHQAARLRHEVDVTSGSVELTSLVRRLEQRFAIVGRHAGIEVAANTPEQEVWVACTPALAERAVANLIQNAVEHNRKPGHVAITLSQQDTQGRFTLVVADDGPGMPQDTLASLQHATFLHDEARPRGPGMGTLITQEVAQRAGWSIHYAPLEPTGLEVRLEGPLIDPKAP